MANAIDGDLLTIWHTEWSTGSPPPPHSFVVNLGSPRAIGGFKYLPPPAGNPNGNIASWRFHTSVDGVNWTLAAQGTFANNSDEKTVLLNANQAPTLASVDRREGVRQCRVQRQCGAIAAALAQRAAQRTRPTGPGAAV